MSAAREMAAEAEAWRADARAALARVFLARLRRRLAANDAPAVEPPQDPQQCE